MRKVFFGKMAIVAIAVLASLTSCNKDDEPLIIDEPSITTLGKTI